MNPAVSGRIVSFQLSPSDRVNHHQATKILQNSHYRDPIGGGQKDHSQELAVLLFTILQAAFPF